MADKLILITGMVGLFDPDAFDEGDQAEYQAKVVSKWKATCGSNVADVYVLSSLFGDWITPTPEQIEIADQILRKLPGRKYFVTDDLDNWEAKLQGWYEVVLDHKRLEIDGDPVGLFAGATGMATHEGVAIHAYDFDDMPNVVSASWMRWGGSYGLMNVHYLISYAKNVGSGFVE